MKNAKKCFLISGILFVLFAIFTVMVKTVDVKPLGCQGTDIGFATINVALASFELNSFWYEMSEILGFVALGVAFGFALFAAWQLLKGKSFKKVDACLYALGAYYVIVLGLYVVFDKVNINFRPVCEDGITLEQSYPSSHTMLAICIFGTAIILFAKYIRNNATLRMAAQYVSIVMILLSIVARALSGVHWFTDIVGAMIISAALVTLYAGVYAKLSEK